MLVFFGILIIIASVLLGLFVLIQNPKGGGLSGTFGGFSNQVMGVRQTTDILERGTWILAIAIGMLCLASSFFISSSSSSEGQRSIMEKNVKTLPNTAPPASSAQFPTTTQPQQQSAQPSAPQNQPSGTTAPQEKK